MYVHSVWGLRIAEAGRLFDMNLQLGNRARNLMLGVVRNRVSAQTGREAMRQVRRTRQADRRGGVRHSIGCARDAGNVARRDASLAVKRKRSLRHGIWSLAAGWLKAHGLDFLASRAGRERFAFTALGPEL